MERIKIDDGSKTYEIENLDGEILGHFRINPSDTNIVAKYDAVTKALTDYLATVDDNITEEKFIEVQNTIVDKLSELVGEDASKTFFSICGPLTPLASGNLYVENVLDAISGIIEQETGKRMEAVNKHMDKYLDGYQK